MRGARIGRITLSLFLRQALMLGGSCRSLADLASESRFRSKRVGELDPGSGPIEVMQNNRVGYSCFILLKYNRCKNSDRRSKHQSQTLVHCSWNIEHYCWQVTIIKNAI